MNLFGNFSRIYSDYRINSVHAIVEPIASGGVASVSPVVHAIDEVNVLGVRAQGYPDLIANLGYLKTGMIATPQRAVHKRLSFAKWLGQNTDIAWRSTIDVDPPTGTTPGLIRQVYPTQATASGSQFVANSVKTLPAMVFAYGVNIAANDQGLILGILQAKTCYDFRRRNLVPGSLQPFPPTPRDKEDEGETANFVQEACDQIDLSASTQKIIAKSVERVLKGQTQ